jgi:hypothetical protein
VKEGNRELVIGRMKEECVVNERISLKKGFE